MKKIILDFSNCKTWDDVYNEIITKCDFPEWCGKNLDAIWELMEDDFVWENEPTLFTIIGTQEMPEGLYALVFKEINDIVFARVMEKAPNVRFEIIS